MFRNKLRIAMTMTVAALVLVGATASADATKKGHNHHQTNAEQHRKLCDDLKTVMEGAQDGADEAWQAGDAAAAADYDAAATKAYNDARKQGCGWATRMPPPEPSHPLGEAPPPDGPFLL